MRTDDPTQDYDDERADGHADEVRALLRSWSAHAVPAPDDPAAGTALDVPPAAVAEVTDAVLRLLGQPAGPLPAGSDELCRIARVLVVDEHPSAAGWTEAERVDVARWIAVLIARDGEEGVQSLVRELRRRDHPGH
ncbi:hypothetical protein [Streptomyces sp. NPDC058579]|uniref:hypothetical protein n=1 Tax=Streptomyces sp. NPDC058579 TaxID=3346548 RepID=UPI00364813AF